MVGSRHAIDSQRQPDGRLAAAIGALVVLAGCVSPGTPTTGPPTDHRTPVASSTADVRERTATTGPSDRDSPDRDPSDRDATPDHASDRTTGKDGLPPSLESRLYGLVTAEDRTAYAAARGLRLRNGSVLVVIELRPGRELPAPFDLTIRTRHRNLVQAFVPVDDLVPIADHGNVSFVRTPREAATDEPSPDTPPWHNPTPTSESSRFQSY